MLLSSMTRAQLRCPTRGVASYARMALVLPFLPLALLVNALGYLVLASELAKSRGSLIDADVKAIPAWQATSSRRLALPLPVPLRPTG